MTSPTKIQQLRRRHDERGELSDSLQNFGLRRFESSERFVCTSREVRLVTRECELRGPIERVVSEKRRNNKRELRYDRKKTNTKQDEKTYDSREVCRDFAFKSQGTPPACAYTQRQHFREIDFKSRQV